MENSKPQRKHHPERITLNEEALERVSFWLEDIRPKLKGTSLTRSALVNWIVCRHGRQLSQEEVSEIVTRHFDPVKVVAWATKQLRELQLKGEKVDVRGFINEVLGFSSRTGRIRSKRAQPTRNDSEGDDV